MAGILDSKERMIDFIITPQGRSQIGDGRMKIEYASLTDLHTFYTSSLPDNVADDASGRLYFEAHTSQTDLITPEIDPGNVMKPFRAGTFNIQGKRMAEGTFLEGTTIETQKTLTGSAVSDGARSFLRSIASHFSGLRILGTEDQFSNSSDFVLDFTTGSFVITNKDMELNHGKGIYLKDLTPDQPYHGEVSLRNTVSIFADPRFSHFPNFQYMPPVNVANPGQEASVMGSYPKLSTDEPDDPLEHLATRQKIELDLRKSSRSNNFIMQVYEFMDSDETSTVNKLSIVDYGIIRDEENDADKHYYFVGKLLRDSEGVDTFINVFTIEFFRHEDEDIT